MTLLSRKEVRMLKDGKAIYAVKSLTERTGCKLVTAYRAVLHYANRHSISVTVPYEP